MLDDSDIQKAADTIQAGFLTKQPQTPLSITYPRATDEDAYRIQQRWVDDRVAEGAVIRGYKVGLTSRPMREQAGIDEPDYGALFEHFFVAESSTVPMSEFVDPAIEVEIAFVMKESLRGPGVTPEDVIRATDYVVPAIEVVDFRLARKGRREGSGIFDTVADLASCGVVVLGAVRKQLGDVDLPSVRGTCIRNGKAEATGLASEVLDDPVNAIAWLANKLTEIGDITFEPGHTILSGSFIPIVEAEAGDHFVAEFDSGFGRVELTFK